MDNFLKNILLLKNNQICHNFHKKFFPSNLQDIFYLINPITIKNTMVIKFPFL